MNIICNFLIILEATSWLSGKLSRLLNGTILDLLIKLVNFGSHDVAIFLVVQVSRTPDLNHSTVQNLPICPDDHFPSWISMSLDFNLSDSRGSKGQCQNLACP